MKDLNGAFTPPPGWTPPPAPNPATLPLPSKPVWQSTTVQSIAIRVAVIVGGVVGVEVTSGEVEQAIALAAGIAWGATELWTLWGRLRARHVLR
jgi:hypothetical protein